MHTLLISSLNTQWIEKMYGTLVESKYDMNTQWIAVMDGTLVERKYDLNFVYNCNKIL